MRAAAQGLAARLDPARILVIAVARIGDTLMITPALRALAARWPKAEITFLGHPKRVEVVEHLPFLAAVGPISKQRALWQGWLPGKRWDLALVFGFDQALVAYALRTASQVVAFRQADEKLNKKLLLAVESPPYQSDHAIPMRLALTRALGVPDAGLNLSYVVTPSERDAAQAVLSGKPKPLVGLQLRAFPTKAWRDWPVPHFLALARRIIERWSGAHFLLFGGPEDAARAEEFVRELPDRSTNLAGQLNLRTAAAVMNELDLFIGLDSGPTHIVGALKPPMIGLYHCLTPSAVIKPLDRPRCYVVDHPNPKGCSESTSIGDITVDAVWEKVVEALR